jgi:enoyl-CoA hydratase/carnithine racemase
VVPVGPANEANYEDGEFFSMSSYTCIKYVLEDHIAVITLQRPQRLNALSVALLQELQSAMRQARSDDQVRVIVITGAPRPDGRPCFSAGDDLKEVASGASIPPGLGFDLTNMIDDLLKPTIAVIDGICSTGAVEVALACDLRVVAETAQISDWHLKNLGSGLGGWGASTRWVRAVGLQQAKDIILTGRVVGGQEAHRIGFAVRVCRSENLWSEAMGMARQIASMDPEGVRLTLAHMDRTEDMSRDQALRLAQILPGWLGVRGSLSGFARQFDGKDEVDPPK